MDKPEQPELEALVTTAMEIREAYDRIAYLKQRIAREALGLSSIADKSERMRSAVYAYWFVQEAPVGELSFAVTGRTYAEELRKHAGKVPLGLTCDRCGTGLAIASRSQLKEKMSRMEGRSRLPRGYELHCEDCLGELRAERDAEYRAAEEESLARCRVLAAMPYADYLKTPEWETQKIRYLENLLMAHRAPFSCETCSDDVALGVYHSTLERLGRLDDLVLLCEICLGALSAQNRLAGLPAPEHTVSPALTHRLEKLHLFPDNP